MNALATAQTQETVSTASNAGLSLIETGVLGALLVFSVCLNAWCIYQLNKVQNLRVDDKEKDGERLYALNEKLITAFSGMKGSLDRVSESTHAVSSGLQAVQNSIDTVITLAVNRSNRPPSGKS